MFLQQQIVAPNLLESRRRTRDFHGAVAEALFALESMPAVGREECATGAVRLGSRIVDLLAQKKIKTLSAQQTREPAQNSAEGKRENALTKPARTIMNA